MLKKTNQQNKTKEEQPGTASLSLEPLVEMRGVLEVKAPPDDSSG